MSGAGGSKEITDTGIEAVADGLTNRQRRVAGLVAAGSMTMGEVAEAEGMKLADVVRMCAEPLVVVEIERLGENVGLAARPEQLRERKWFAAKLGEVLRDRIESGELYDQKIMPLRDLFKEFDAQLKSLRGLARENVDGGAGAVSPVRIKIIMALEGMNSDERVAYAARTDGLLQLANMGGAVYGPTAKSAQQGAGVDRAGFDTEIIIDGELVDVDEGGGPNNEGAVSDGAPETVAGSGGSPDGNDGG